MYIPTYSFTDLLILLARAAFHAALPHLALLVLALAAAGLIRLSGRGGEMPVA